MLTDTHMTRGDGHAHDQTDRQTDTNFKSNQALVVSSHYLSFKLIGHSVFELESGNQNILDECMPKMGKSTNPIFKSNQSLLVSYHTVKFPIDSESENLNVDGQMDRQPDRSI